MRAIHTRNMLRRVDNKKYNINPSLKELDLLENMARVCSEVDKGVDVIDGCICDNCSSTVLKGWTYCSYCGIRLLWGDDTI